MEIPPEEQARRVAELRRVRYGYFLALHVVLLRAAGRPPSDIAAVLFCSRSSVYRAVPASHAGHWAELRGGGRESGSRALCALLDRTFTVTETGGARHSARCPTALWLVPHALELCHSGDRTLQAAADHGFRRDGTPVGARTGLGMETCEGGGQG